MVLRATVRGGRLILDEPANLPDGIVLDLVVDDEGDELGRDDHAALDEAIARSLDDEARGATSPASVILDKLRARNER